MKKIITIEGMHCAHCEAAAQKALNSIPGVEARVSLKKKQAVVTLKEPVPDETFRSVLHEAGYEATSIEEKKGIFG